MKNETIWLDCVLAAMDGLDDRLPLLVVPLKPGSGVTKSLTVR